MRSPNRFADQLVLSRFNFDRYARIHLFASLVAIRSSICGMLFLVWTLALATTSMADDWSHWMGPNRNNTWNETNIIESFPEGGPPVVWTTPLGPGYGGAAIRDGELFLLDREPGGEIVRCLDPSTGVERWRFAYEARGRMNYDGSRSTPTVSGHSTAM